MRFFLLFLLTMLPFLQAKESQNKVTLGLGAYIQTQPYTDAQSIIVPSPVIFFDNSLFYVRWSRAGLYFLGNKSEDLAWGFSLTAQPRPFGYKPTDSDALKGLNERETTFEGGLAFSAASDGKYIEVMALTDLLKRYESWLIKAEVGDKYSYKKFTFYPSFIISYQSEDFMDYYYGITQEEAKRTTYDYYKADAGFQLGLQTYIERPITENLSILFNLRVDLLPQSAQKSPIIQENLIYSGLASLIYTFHY